MDPVTQLKSLPKTQDFFIGFDSDGCVFDSMEIKQKECFCPAFIKHYGLQKVSKYAREVWEFVNLYSKNRGCNRFFAVQFALEFLRNRHEVQARHAAIAQLPDLAAWTKEESKLSSKTLGKKVENSTSEELKMIYAWSLEVDARIKDMVYDLPPFPGVTDVLQAGLGKADMIVVSQTPVEALQREWKENDIDQYVSLIAGSEFGTKTEHLKLAAGGKYAPEKILMVGDAPGDLKAANGVSALFYPIIPGREEACWERFVNEALGKFFAGTYAGAYQQELNAEFDAALPEKPTW